MTTATNGPTFHTRAAAPAPQSRTCEGSGTRARQIEAFFGVAPAFVCAQCRRAFDTEMLPAHDAPE